MVTAVARRRMAAVLVAIAAATIGLQPTSAHPAWPASPDALYATTAARVLSRDFSAPDVSYLLLELPTGAVIASQWDDSDKPIPVGSLVKPFTALAYAETHHFRFPRHTCAGGGTCWRPRGHGAVDIVRATAVSCNAYFHYLAENVSTADVISVSHRLGLNGPDFDAGPDGMTGRNGAWRESPQAIAHAFAELLGRSSQPGVREIAEGMTGAARDGTAAAFSEGVPRLPVVAKTGTAPCTHARHAPGDGFVIAAWPASAPRYLLLVRQHGVPGARAAVLAARMLRALEPAP